MKSLILTAFALSIASISTVSIAEETAPAAAVTPKLGKTIWSADGKRIGSIDNIRRGADGAAVSVGVIHSGRLVYLPISTLSQTPKGLASSMSIKDLK